MYISHHPVRFGNLVPKTDQAAHINKVTEAVSEAKRGIVAERLTNPDLKHLQLSYDGDYRGSAQMIIRTPREQIEQAYQLLLSVPQIKPLGQHITVNQALFQYSAQNGYSLLVRLEDAPAYIVPMS